MDFGGFRIEEPIPQLDNPHMFVTVRDWVNVGNVGSMALNYMGESFDSKKLGRIEKPGIYYDFTRYRPKRKKDGTLSVPNTSINYIIDVLDTSCDEYIIYAHDESNKFQIDYLFQKPHKMLCRS